MCKKWPALVALLGALVLGGAAAAQPSPLRVPGPLSARNASYVIRARLDEKQHRVTGQLRLAFRNLERQPAPALVFHLYYNAFKRRLSTFIREAGSQLRGDEMPADGFGAVDVTALRVAGQDLLAQARVDDTLLWVPLPQPVAGGAAVEVELSFEAQLPKLFARAGYQDDFHAAGQWFPKLGVFACDEAGGCRFRARQYHGFTEFFSDYGTYDVELDVPARHQVGATGVLVDRQQHGDRATWRFRAEDVHDFAWFSDPGFVLVEDQIRDDWGVVRVRLFSRAGQARMEPRHLRAAREGLLELERRFGPYPYSTLTIIVPPRGASGGAGMEYPTLFTTEEARDEPGFLRLAEGTTAHELAHQYFYGLIGTDEVEEAWMDEGLTEASGGWMMERLFGRCAFLDLPGLCLTPADGEWLAARSSQRRWPLSTPSYRVIPGYAATSYSQPTVVLRTLERYLGPARLESAMRRYTDRFRFHHPRRADFEAAMSEGAGEDLAWFFRQALTQTRAADYAIASIKSSSEDHRGGLWDCPPPPLPQVAPPARPEHPALIEPPTLSDPEVLARTRQAWEAACQGKPKGRHLFTPAKNPKDYDSEVIVQRRGDFVFPVTVRLTYADGRAEQLRWSVAAQEAAPEERLLRLTRSGAKLLRAEVDPEGQLLLDERRWNNGMLVERDPAPARRVWLRFVTFLQAVLETAGGL